jgi:aquaporin Z
MAEPTTRAGAGANPHKHWPDYLIEAGALWCFMVSACAFGTLLWHPASPVHVALGDGWAQRGVMGAFMGLTAMAIIYSPWGRRSGALMNPALTLTFLRLGRIAPRDAAWYVAAQFMGGALGVMAAHLLLRDRLAHPAVSYVVTRPGPAGIAVAFAAEAAISALLMTVVLRANASERWKRYTGVLGGLLVATYILVESPLSGMSMNPARSLGSALAAGSWTALWVYFTAPLLGMQLAAQLHLARRRAVPCPKMAHVEPCHFCDYARARAHAVLPPPVAAPSLPPLGTSRRPVAR